MSNVEFSLFKKILRQRGYFVTKPRLRLFALLHHHPEITIKQLTRLADKNDQSTVYRNLNLLEELQVIKRLRLGWSSKVELSDTFQHHHHHMTCLKCSRITSLPDDDLIEKRIRELVAHYSFTQTDHELEIRGLCQQCQSFSLQKTPDDRQ